MHTHIPPPHTQPKSVVSSTDLASLPDPPCRHLEECVVGPTDPRAGLRGSRSTRVRLPPGGARELRKCSVLGAYRFVWGLCV